MTALSGEANDPDRPATALPGGPGSSGPAHSGGHGSSGAACFGGRGLFGVALPDGLDELAGCYPRSGRPVLRVNFIASADGAVSVDGLSAGLQGPGDKEVFDTLRMGCDALVVAAGTVRAEGYDALRLTAAGRAWRVARGLPEFPLMVIVSGSLELDPEQLIFADAPIRPIVLTHRGAPDSPIREVAEVVAVGEREVDLAAGVRLLHDRGATQILCEGGPGLLGSMIAADLVDELCLTVAPLLVGGAAGRIAHGPSAPARRMSLCHALTREDMLFLRYARANPE